MFTESLFAADVNESLFAAKAFSARFTERRHETVDVTDSLLRVCFCCFAFAAKACFAAMVFGAQAWCKRVVAPES